jgi:hypothetical protein
MAYAFLKYNERMPKPRKWNEQQLSEAVASSTSIRSVLLNLGLKPAGGNYRYVNEKIVELGFDKSHFKGKAWNKGLVLGPKFNTPIIELLTENSSFQSHKLKIKLFQAGLKKPVCELCGWALQSADGRIPVELDHINGIRTDNRLENLRILCPNCHSLQPTHRGKNIRKHARVV